MHIADQLSENVKITLVDKINAAYKRGYGLSSGAQNKHEELVRELRRFQGLSASLFRAAAARSGMTGTDLQVLDLLESVGPATAGQLADLTGLTTGAITGMLNRLEEAGRVRRERDPSDGRRVIVRLAPGTNARRAGGTPLASLGMAWEDLASRYNEEQMAVILAFLKDSNAQSSEALIRLREAPVGEGGIHSAPLGDLESGRLVVSCGISQLTMRADEGMAALYQARFEGPAPEVAARGGTVTIRYPRRLWALGGRHGAAEIALSAAIPWQIVIQGGAAQVDALLGRLPLAGLEVKGGLSAIHLELPVPSGVVPIRISGGASDITVRRPAGVAARAHLKGWASAIVFDDQSYSAVGNDVRLYSPGYDATAPRYDIDIASSASMVTITSE
jgi:DNA-binding MarR family transcriptional regulator